MSSPADERMSEELLDANEIQGNILAGFNKDHQVFLFLRMGRDAASVSAVRAWLRAIGPQISSVAEVRLFNELFRTLRGRLRRDPHGLIATWVNIAFSAAALEVLTSRGELDEFADAFFLDGMALRAGDLGDPLDPAAEGHPDNWVVGGTRSEADILLIVASDSPSALAERVTQLKATLTQAADPQSGVAIGSALHVIWEQEGETLPPPLTGHEHFGFKDGVSQPGVRGLVRLDPVEYITPRLIDPAQSPQTEPTVPEFARPGQPLVWPGQFVFGYKRQSTNDARVPPEGVMAGCPPWGRNGSFLVFRRLRQDVPAFRASMREQAALLAREKGFEGMTATRLASLLVGRWPSGAPLMRSPAGENAELGRDEYASNFFQFSEKSPPPMPLKPEVGYAGDHFNTSEPDQGGVTCPFSAHVRKVNPRDTITEQGNRQDVLTRLVLRRGIPFGPVYPGDLDDAADTAPLAGGEISTHRGLLFVSYQTSIENQFAFLQQNWANHPTFPTAGGEDPIIGQTNENEGRARFVQVRAANQNPLTLTLPPDWVIPTGGGFFFSPAISVIAGVLGRPR
ncbi:MAG TPA: Dyp-type peroxidase [Pyrinomonadaceae bacterium]|nr:Dyp-type peroxidase [Pyrinomonadaceae bacterium]